MTLGRLTLVFLLLVPAATLDARALKDAVVEKTVEGSPEWAVQKTLDAGRRDDLAGWFKDFCHPDLCIDTPTNRADMEKYTWKRFRKFVDSYLVDPAKLSFKVVKAEPSDFDDKAPQVKLFLHSSKRDMPAPIVLKKDASGRFKVFSLSL